MSAFLAPASVFLKVEISGAFSRLSTGNSNPLVEKFYIYLLHSARYQSRRSGRRSWLCSHDNWIPLIKSKVPFEELLK